MKPKFVCTCLVVLVCLLFAGCEKATADTASWKEPFNLRPQALSQDRSNFEKNGDLQGALQELYKICSNQPETLASVVSAFPSIYSTAGFSGEPTARMAQEIDDYISNDEHGGNTQEALLEKVRELFESPHTSSRFTMRSGKAEMIYMYRVDENLPSSPDNIRLISMPTELLEDEYPCLEITITGLDGEPEVGIFYLPGGFQRIIP